MSIKSVMKRKIVNSQCEVEHPISDVQDSNMADEPIVDISFSLPHSKVKYIFVIAFLQ